MPTNSDLVDPASLHHSAPVVSEFSHAPVSAVVAMQQRTRAGVGEQVSLKSQTDRLASDISKLVGGVLNLKGGLDAEGAAKWSEFLDHLNHVRGERRASNDSTLHQAV